MNVFQSSEVYDHPLIIENRKSILEAIPNIRYQHFNDEEARTYILRNYNKRMVYLYDRINPVYGCAKCDFFRYLLVFNEGGLYLDIKSSVTRRINEYTSCQMLLSNWGDPIFGKHSKHGVDEEYQQFFILAQKKHPYLRNVISYVINNISNYNIEINGVGHLGVLKTTGPIAYTLAIKESPNYPHTKIINHEQAGIIYNNLGESYRKVIYYDMGRSYYGALMEPVIL